MSIIYSYSVCNYIFFLFICVDVTKELPNSKLSDPLDCIMALSFPVSK